MSRVSVVTGGTSGIGQGIAEKILEHSGPEDLVFVTYGHNRERAEAFFEALPEEKKKGYSSAGRHVLL